MYRILSILSLKTSTKPIQRDTLEDLKVIFFLM